MEHSAIYHNADKKQCFCMEKGRFLIRLKTKKDDLVKVVLHYQDKYIPVERFDTRAQTEMKKICSDRYSDYYEAEVEMDVVCLRYFFELTDKDGAVKYYSNHDFYDVISNSIQYLSFSLLANPGRKSLPHMVSKSFRKSYKQKSIFIVRTTAEAEAPILWPPDAKRRLTGKDSDDGRD